MVKRHASAAVTFIEEQFEARNSRVRALTSKGSLLDTIAFRSEETQEGVGFHSFYDKSCGNNREKVVTFLRNIIVVLPSL